MLPYWAILKDSFREALHSYVLWALVLVLTSVLLVLAPFGYSEQLTGNLPWDDVPEWRLLLFAMKEGSQSKRPSPSKHLWSLVDKRLRTKADKLWADLKKLEDQDMSALSDDEQNRIAEQVRDVCTSLHRELGRLLGEPEFFDQPSWAAFDLTDEGQELVKLNAAELADKRLRRRNRLLLEAAYPLLVRKSASLSVRPTYMGREIPQFPWLPIFGYVGAPPSTTKEAVVEWYRSYISFMMNWPVTMILVMVGIVATSSIIPRMLDAGSISLLLSKPVSRSLLYIAKFVGGCAFMFLSAAYVIVGIWLIAGLRIGIWDLKVFLCIPLFTFAFAVYFAVSAYVGLVWRSAIVSVLAVVLFWALCWMIGTAKVAFEDRILDNARFTKIIDTGEAILAVDEIENTFFWDEQAQEWKATFKRPTVFGMGQHKSPLVYDEKHKQLLSASMTLTGPAFIVGRDEDAWASKTGLSIGMPLVDLLIEPDGDVLGVSRVGFGRLKGSVLADEKSPVELLLEKAIESAGPDKPLAIDGPMAVAIDGERGLLAVYTGGVLATYKPDKQGKYVRVERRELPDSEQLAATLAISRQTLMVGREDGKLLVLDAKTLRERQSLSPEGETPPRFIAASPDGKWFAILFQNRQLWLYDTQNETLRRAGLWSQGDISAIAWNSPDTLLVVDKIARVRELEVPSLAVKRTFSPRRLPLLGDGWTVFGREISYLTVHRYFVTPLYNILPRPGELGRTLNYFVTGKTTLASGESDAGSDRDIAADRHLQRNPWTPVWSCAIFIAVMLGLGCWLMERREF